MPVLRKWNVFERTDFGPEGEDPRELAAFLEQLDKDATRFEEMRDGPPSPAGRQAREAGI